MTRWILGALRDVARLLGGVGASMGCDSFAGGASAGAVAAFGTAALGDEGVLAGG